MIAVRKAQTGSNPLDPTLIARRTKKHLNELEVITVTVGDLHLELIF